ncbi:MAG: clan AA aspartic protease [Lentisphaerae bacterium]|nr:clan AA aspartic protease [Lentisphaerota bacterium]
MKSQYRIAICVIVSVFLFYTAAADTIHLTNGRSMEGIVCEETPDRVVLDLGVGRATIPRNKIKAIEKFDNDANEKLTDEWRRKHYLNEKYVPRDLREMVADYRKLMERRNSAIRVRNDLAGSDAEKKALDRELELTRSKLVETSGKLKQISAEKDQEKYNNLVVQMNTLAADMNIIRAKAVEIGERNEKARAALSDYLSALSEFRHLFEESAAPTSDKNTEERKYLLDRIAELLVGLESEISSVSMDTVLIGGSTVVTAMINDRIAGRFILDTGATAVTISEEFANRLKLDLKGLSMQEVVLADGSTAEATAVRLSSVQLGDARVENVYAVVLPAKPGKLVDGLLGMSFLSNFVLSFDGGSGKLVLKQFKPK